MSLVTAVRRGAHRRRRRAVLPAPPAVDRPRDAVPVDQVVWRREAKVAGRVRSVRVQPWAGVPTLECVLVDDTAGISLVFLGRRQLAGIHPGTRLVAEGMVGDHNGRLAILNPVYDFLPA